MKLKFIITIFLAIILSEFSIANFYKKGDSLTVWATSGLNMREGPGTDFPKMKKLEYGDKVHVIDNQLHSKSLSLTILKKNKRHNQFKLNGYWVKVKTGKREGYVFDGYLSRLPAMVMKKNIDNEIFFEHFNEYAKREFGIDSTALNADSLKHYDERFVYQNGMEWKYPRSECYFASLNLGEISFNEAYLIFEKMTSFEHHAKYFHPRDLAFNEPGKPLEWDYFQTTVEKEKSGFYKLQFDTDFFGMTLQFVGGKFIISEWGCC
ncbi:MAG: SH3 domain-containing protein [Saprospiraceae bacterium]